MGFPVFNSMIAFGYHTWKQHECQFHAEGFRVCQEALRSGQGVFGEGYDNI